MTAPYDPISLVPAADQADHAAGTVNYPSDDGVSLERVPFFILNILADDVTLDVQVSVDRTNWVSISDYCEDLVGGGWWGGPVVFPAGVTTHALVQGWLLLGEYLRVRATYPNTTNGLEVLFGRRSLT